MKEFYIAPEVEIVKFVSAKALASEAENASDPFEATWDANPDVDGVG